MIHKAAEYSLQSECQRNKGLDYEMRDDLSWPRCSINVRALVKDSQQPQLSISTHLFAHKSLGLFYYRFRIKNEPAIARTTE